MPRMVALIVVAAALTVGFGSHSVLVAAAQSGDAGAATTVPATTVPATTGAAGNPFLPDRENVTDCISVLERPGCGSESKGGIHQLYAFGAMVLGLGFIGWRVVVAVRRAERQRHG